MRRHLLPDTRQEFEAAGVNYQDREPVVDGDLIAPRQPAGLSAVIRAILRIIGLLR